MGKTRPSPTASATLSNAGARSRGNDGRMYYVAVTAAGVHRWQLVRERERERAMRTVAVVDNGGRPFKVRLSSVSGKGCAEVLVKSESTYKLWRSFEYDKARIGLDPNEKTKGFWGSDEGVWWHGGHCVLLRLPMKGEGKGRPVYIFIGPEIYSFVPPDDIHSFVSVMGNSASPYTFAVGTSNTYLLSENTLIPNSMLRRAGERAKIDIQDPYEIYYKLDLTTCLPWTSMRSHNIKRRLWEAAYKLPQRRVLHKRI